MSFALLALLPLFWGCSANEAPLAGTPVDPAVLFEHSTFADAALELEVRSLLGRPRGELSTAELNSIEILDAGRKGIEDLTGIDRLANLRVLRLSANAFSDINPLQMLKRLEELDLGQNNITDAGGLTALGTLQVLVLSNNQLTEIGPLAQLTRLRQLDLPLHVRLRSPGHGCRFNRTDPIPRRPAKTRPGLARNRSTKAQQAKEFPATSHIHQVSR